MGGVKREPSVDFAKGVLILLMVLFHLSYFIGKMPNGTCELVYTFHMPGFLVLSGFFTSMDDPVHRVRKMARGVVVPYFLFEVLYLIGLGMMGRMVGSNNHFELSVPNLADTICLNPIGTYWYLHTLIICTCVYALFSVRRMCLSGVNAVIAASVCCWGLSFLIDGLKWENCMYFFAGAYIRLLYKDIKQIIIPTWLAGIAFVFLCFGAEEYGRYTLGGLFITLSSMSFLFAAHKIVGRKAAWIFEKCGKNSLIIVLMSPFYMIPSKFYSRFFDFEPTGLLFGLFSLALITGLCLYSAIVLDRIGISRKVFGKELYM